MVLEALTAVGLAGNIVQFIQFGCELVSLSKCIRKSPDGLPPNHVDLHLIAQDLATHSGHLASASPPTDTLRLLVQKSHSVAEDLRTAVDDIKNARQKNSKGEQSRRDTFRQALETVWKRDKIAILQARLESLRDQTQYHLVSEIRETQVDMASSLRSLRESNVALKLEFSDRLINIAKTFDDINDRFASFGSPNALLQLERSFSDFCLPIDEMVDTNAILRSLQFQSMTIRHSAITSAHKRTFDWIYRTERLPSDDPRSRIDFTSWLRHGRGVYWVTGKPGSGKSTLMKFLENHEASISLLQEWASPSRLVTASFYFWNAGTAMQKSLQGLLQSLLFCLLSNCPLLVHDLCPERLGTGKASGTASSPWSLEELRRAFERLKEQRELSAKFYLHVDGLDEYEGDHYEVIKIIQSLAESPDIKICVSSRPWNCFQDTIGESNRGSLTLHRLTAVDIELFARETILSHRKHSKTAKQTQEYDDLIHEIQQRAQGVFLWVRLVVHSLRDGLINDDQVSLLRRRLEELPTDLEEFFEHILSSIDKIYQEQTAKTFLTALAANGPLRIIHYSFLDDDDPNFGWSSIFVPLSREEIIHRNEQTQRRLNGRYKGLLEPSSHDVHASTGVDFLHRTLRDFLETPKMKNFLESRKPDGFDPLTATMQVRLAEAKCLNTRPSPENFAEVLRFAQELGTTGNTSLEFSIIDHLERISSRLWPYTTGLEMACRGTMLPIALHIGRDDYVRHAISKPEFVGNLDWLLMHAATCPRSQDTFASIFQKSLVFFRHQTADTMQEQTSDPSWQRYAIEDCDSLTQSRANVVRLLLEKGADPNGVVQSTSVWGHFLNCLLKYLKQPYEEQYWEVFKLMVLKGADVHSHCDIWFRLVQGAKMLPAKTFELLNNGLALLLNHGLNPNTSHNGNSIWIEFMFSFLERGPNNIDSDSTRAVIRSFLQRGAQMATLLVPLRLRGKETDSWLQKALDQIPESRSSFSDFTPHSVFELLLQHGFDPNEPFKDLTVWEHLLQNLRKGLLVHDHGFLCRKINHELVLLFLRYRADPCAESLHQLLFRDRCLLGQSETLALQVVVRREMNDLQSRNTFAESRKRKAEWVPKHHDSGNPMLDQLQFRRQFQTRYSGQYMGFSTNDHDRDLQPGSDILAYKRRRM